MTLRERPLSANLRKTGGTSKVFDVHEIQAMWRLPFMHACAQSASTASDRTPPFICAMIMVSRVSASCPSDKADGDNVNLRVQGPGSRYLIHSTLSSSNKTSGCVSSNLGLCKGKFRHEQQSYIP
jgi:hypothetical protein